MQLAKLTDILSGNSYPGRGIVIGRSADGKKAVIIYFIMGRSENSRNRVFTEKDGGIITEPHDPSKMSDPSLIIYAPVRVAGDVTIVTNGDQTDTIYDFISAGKSFEDALRTRTFEPDSPNFTPRVSGIIERAGGGFCYKLSILKSCMGDPASAERFFFDYPSPRAGEGRFIHTYMGDGSPLPSFEGEPAAVAIEGGLDDIAGAVWRSLNAGNRVSLFVREIDIESGAAKTRIINRHR